MSNKIGRRNVLSVVVLAGIVLFGSLLAGAADTPQAHVFFILDASGSMWGRVENTEKIVIAKDVMIELIENLPETIDVGLEVYGHRKKGDCADIEIMTPLGQGNQATLIQQIQGITPKGKTPLTKSLEIAGEHLQAFEKETTIVLVSDGKETCEGDPCALVQDLKAKGIHITVHVIGFDVTAEETEQLACIAEAGGGRYFAAQNAGQLQAALTEVSTEVIQKAEATPTPRPAPTPTPQTVKKKKVIKRLPAVGKLAIPNLTAREIEVHTQQSSGKDEYTEGFAGWITPDNTTLELPEGTYKLKFGNNYFVEGVEVAAGETVEIRVATLSIPNLTERDVDVYTQTSDGKDEYTDGFVGWIEPNEPLLEVAEGRYKLKFGNNYFVEGVEIAAGETVEIRVATLSIPNLTKRDVDVYTQQSSGKDEYTEGFVGWIEPDAPFLEVAEGTYKLKFGNNYFVEGVEVAAGETVEIQVATLRLPTLKSREVDVYTQQSSGKDEYTDGFVGWIEPDAPFLEVAEGTYKLKFGNNYFVDGVEVAAGETVELLVGAITVAEPSQAIEVHVQDASGKDEYADGFVGWIEPDAPTVEVPAGTYKLKFGDQFVEDIVVGPGEEIVLE